MKINIIAAIGKNRELGNKNELLWNIPEDMRHFRELTTGNVIIMGQKTFESIGKSLPNRINIVLSQDENFNREGCFVVRNKEEALEIAKKYTEKEIFIIGGGMIYTLFLEEANCLYLTLVHATFEADVFFPKYDHIFTKIVSEREGKDEHYSYTFTVLEK